MAYNTGFLNLNELCLPRNTYSKPESSGSNLKSPRLVTVLLISDERRLIDSINYNCRAWLRLLWLWYSVSSLLICDSFNWILFEFVPPRRSSIYQQEQLAPGPLAFQQTNKPPMGRNMDEGTQTTVLNCHLGFRYGFSFLYSSFL